MGLLLLSHHDREDRPEHAVCNAAGLPSVGLIF